jgi:predicted DCC family thiol-disulfide oxidoreductase YuxK
LAKLEIFYNNACPVCAAGIASQRRRMNPLGLEAAWKDIAADETLVCEIGADLDKVRHSLHVRDENGIVHVGADAIARLMLETPGQIWLGRLMMWPPLRPVSRWLYDRFADQLFAWNRRHGRW